MTLWIESHQRLRNHPKVKRAAKLLDVSRPTLLGHLHLLWWWALDHARDGIILADDIDLLIEEVDWEGEPDVFLKALVACGGRGAGFLEALPGGDYAIHDWGDHGGKAVQRRDPRQRGKWGMHRRWHVKEGKHSDDCEYCGSHSDSGHSHSDSDYSDYGSDYIDLYNDSTGQDTTEEDNTLFSSEAEASDQEDGYVCTVQVCRCEDPAVRELTRDVARMIRDNGFKIPPAGTKANHSWVAEIDKLLRIDEAAHDEVRAVASWATDDPFWSANIQSTPKLREKFPQLRLKYHGRHATGAQPANLRVSDFGDESGRFEP